jgi:uncharacterized protein YbjT (DUF2867 family)
MAVTPADETRASTGPQREARSMKIVVIGGIGLIGSKVVQNLRQRGHDAVAADLKTGVNTITGEGLDSALADARVVVDVTNSPSFEDAAVLEFFQTSGRNLLKAEVNAGVGHHVALSIVGADRLPDSGYLRAKVAQEQLIEAAGQPYTIIRSTQFFEFLRGIADSATDGDTVSVPTAKLQPIAAQDVAAAVTEAALSDPINGVIEIGGPAAISFTKLIRDVLNADNDPRTVVGAPHARYFGTELTDASLTPGPDARVGPTTFAEWLAVNHRQGGDHKG